MTRHTVALKRAYDPPSPEDGKRVLVDRLWPRGVSKAEAHIDLWLKDVAPSTDLRTWFAHDPAKWGEFERRYRAELAKNPALEELRELVATHSVTLVYGAKDTEHNQAVVLQRLLTA
ncbi:DUF488 domain-containing protein [Gemmatimonas aurantiaca]|uniref:DUF488 domain-containing protein n=1 Tax=Gemmatimonas aurantiaca TaxID=173480 RepID=UPI00301C01DC